MKQNQVDIETIVKMSYGGPRNDREWKVTFPTVIEMRDFVFRHYARILVARHDGQRPCPKSIELFSVKTGEQLAFIGTSGVLLDSPVGPVYFDEDFSVLHYIEDLHKNPLNIRENGR